MRQHRRAEELCHTQILVQEGKSWHMTRLVHGEQNRLIVSREKGYRINWQHHARPFFGPLSLVSNFTVYARRAVIDDPCCFS